VAAVAEAVERLLAPKDVAALQQVDREPVSWISGCGALPGFMVSSRRRRRSGLGAGATRRCSRGMRASRGDGR
jgi:hypothetical protein